MKAQDTIQRCRYPGSMRYIEKSAARIEVTVSRGTSEVTVNHNSTVVHWLMALINWISRPFRIRRFYLSFDVFISDDDLIKGDAIVDSPTAEKATKELRELLSEIHPKSAVIKIGILDYGSGAADELRKMSRDGDI